MAAAAVQSGVTLKAPSKIKNSPMKPFKPGSPMDEKVTAKSSAEKSGTCFHRPPKSAISREWRRS